MYCGEHGETGEGSGCTLRPLAPSSTTCVRCGASPDAFNPVGSLAVYRGRMEWFRALDLPCVWIVERGVCAKCGGETAKAGHMASLTP